MRLLPAATLLLALLAPAREAAAQSPPSGADVALQVAAAKTLLEEGKKLLEAGRLVEAREKLEASIRNDPSPAALLALGVCQERLGMTASAWGTLHRAEERARMLGDGVAAEEARKRAAVVEPALARVKVEPPRGIATLEIRLDGRHRLTKDEWGTALPVDPGEHEITAAVAGRSYFKTVVTAAREGGTVVVAVPAPPLPPPAPPSRAELPPPGPPRKTSSLGRDVALVVVAGVGAIGAVSAIVGLGIVAANPRSERVTIAGATMLIGGGVLMIPAGIWLLVEKTGTKKTTRAPLPVQVSPLIARDGGGLILQGAF